MDHKTELKGYGLVFTGALFVILPYLTVRHVFVEYSDISVFNVALWGMGGAALVMFPYFLFPQPRKELSQEWQRNKKTLVLISIITAIGATLWFYGLSNGTAGLVGFLKKTDIFFSFLLGVLFLKERFSVRELLFGIISIIGYVLISKLEGEISPLAIVAILICAILYSLQSYVVKKNVLKMSAAPFAFIRLVLICSLFLIFGIISGSITMIPFEAILYLVGGQISGAFLGRIFYFKAHQYLSISKIGFLSLFGPLFVFISSVIFLGEKTQGQKLLGFALILLGMGLFLGEKFRLSRRQK